MRMLSLATLLAAALLGNACAAESSNPLLDDMSDSADEAIQFQYLGRIDMQRTSQAQSYILETVDGSGYYVLDIARPAEFTEEFGLALRLDAVNGLSEPSEIDLDSPPLSPPGSPQAVGLVLQSNQQQPLDDAPDHCMSPRGCTSAEIDVRNEAVLTDFEEQIGLNIEPTDLGIRLAFTYRGDLVPGTATITLACNENCL